MISIKVEDLVVRYRTLNGISIQNDFFQKKQKRYEYTAINHMSFQVEKGEILGLIGQNGSGKSTLLKALGGMLDPDSGTIDLGGQSVALLAIGVGFKPQMTGRENIYIAGLLLGFPQKEIRKKEQEIIEFAELDEFIDMPVRTYSSGMYSRLGFAITATLETDIILIDEVLSVGDERFQKKSYEKMRQLISNKDKTVIICSHSRSILSELCDRVLWIDNGRVIQIGNAECVLDEYQNYMQGGDIMFEKIDMETGEESHEFQKGKVSIVTPVYNGEFHLSRMLESVLNQTYEQIEMILVDDGSTDGTVAVAESFQEKFAAKGYGYHIIQAKHKCASAAINQGLPYVSGEYLIWPDSDDVLEPESVKRRVDFLKNHPHYQCVRSLSYYFNAETGELSERADEKTGDLSKEDLFWDILESKTFVCCGCYMLRSERFFEIYPERHIPEYTVGQNFQMLLPFMHRYKCPTIQEKLYGVYTREGSHSRRQLTEAEELKKYRDYEKMIDEIALICNIKDRASKDHLTYWKANRRRQIAWKYDRKGLLVSALFQLYRCGNIGFRQMIKDSAGAIYRCVNEKLYQYKQQIITRNEIKRVYFCKKKLLALTFDATWGNTYTTSLLEKLKQYNVKATFFISGIWIETYPEDYRKIFEDGHDIGNHSYKHPLMLELTEEEICREIDRTEQLSQNIINTGCKFFRFPYGKSNKDLIKLVGMLGFIPVKWTIDSWDWKEISAEEICRNVIQCDDIGNGAIILMHNNGEHTVEALDLIIPALKEKGYELVKVSELLNAVPLYKHRLKKLRRKYRF